MRKLGRSRYSLVFILVILAVCFAAGAGWYLYGFNIKPRTAPDVIGGVSPAERDFAGERGVPQGWVVYEGLPDEIRFYYPPAWRPTFTIRTGGIYDHLPFNYGTSEGLAFNKENARWIRYADYGTDKQRVVAENNYQNTEYALRTVVSRVSDYPIAYLKHTRWPLTTHDIYIINGTRAYQIRLPEINANDAPSGWKNMVDEQTAAIPSIIDSIEFSN